MKFVGKTEYEKYFEEALSLCRNFGIDVNTSDITIKDLEIPRDLYLNCLKYMKSNKLVSHFKHILEGDKFEQAIIIKEELNNRNIKINIV